MVKHMDSVHIVDYNTGLCLRFCSCATETQLAVLSDLDLTVILCIMWFLKLWCVYHCCYANHNLLVHDLNKISKYKRG
jgi:hypothetical protein